MKLKKNASGVLFITYECPHCHCALKNKAEEIGRPHTCRDCGGQFPIPGKEIYQNYLAAQTSRQQTDGAQAQPEPKPARQSAARPNRNQPEPSFEPLQLQDEFSGGDYRYSRVSTSHLGSGRSGNNSNAFDDYVDLTLKKGETILMQFGPAAAAVLALQILLAVMSLIWILIFVSLVFFGNADIFTKFGAVVYTFCMFVLPTLIALMRIMKRKYTITNQRVVSRSGLASLSVNEVRNDSVSGLSIRQSLFGRWFGYGTVHLYADGMNLKLTSVDQPIEIASAVQSAIQSAKAIGN